MSKEIEEQFGGFELAETARKAKELQPANKSDIAAYEHKQSKTREANLKEQNKTQEANLRKEGIEIIDLNHRYAGLDLGI